jgi:RimJ/RimL family protein N-acetyltransferase
MIRATPADRAQIEAFLSPHAERAMFPLNNLAHYGMPGGHPFAVTLWLARQNGQITDVLTQSDSGMVMPFLPSQDYAAAARALRGRAVIGIVGPRPCARGVAAATGLTRATKSLDQDEPLFALTLASMTLPDGPGEILPLTAAPPDILKSWMLDYQLNTLNTPPDQAHQQAQDGYARYTTTGSHMVLMDSDTPLAMTGFNAQLPHIVQIGGVYTPPALRGQGHARRAVALHLMQARNRGVHRATLFSASDMAARAYRAIGFSQIGDWSLILLRNKETVA